MRQKFSFSYIFSSTSHVSRSFQTWNMDVSYALKSRNNDKLLIYVNSVISLRETWKHSKNKSFRYNADNLNLTFENCTQVKCALEKLLALFNNKLLSASLQHMTSFCHTFLTAFYVTCSINIARSCCCLLVAMGKRRVS